MVTRQSSYVKELMTQNTSRYVASVAWIPFSSHPTRPAMP
jgi:hypothetical protein